MKEWNVRKSKRKSITETKINRISVGDENVSKRKRRSFQYDAQVERRINVEIERS